MTILIIVGLVWLVVVTFTVALLRIAAQADRAAAEPEQPAVQRRRRPRGEPVSVGRFPAEDRRSPAGDRRVAARAAR